jgi:hypothetical protein
VLDSFLRKVLERLAHGASKPAILAASAALVKWLLAFHAASRDSALNAQLAAARTAAHDEKKAPKGGGGKDERVDGIPGLALGQVH